jgi:small subunit ribosomal protein S20
MPIKHAAFKHLRKTKKQTARNRQVASTIKDQTKALRKAIAAKDFAKAETALKAAIKLIDKARQNKVLHKNTAARNKSRLTKSLNVAKAKK